MGTRPRLPGFEALRGLAALAVVVYHALYQPSLVASDENWLWRYGVHLDVAVPIFLGISGFLLYRPFVAARLEGRPRPSLRRYGIGRVLRIVPGYWFALTALALWFWANPPGFEEVRSAEGVLRFYGFAQIYDDETALQGIGQAWTLGVEVVYYAALPLWVVFARRFSVRTELIGLAVVAAASMAYKVVVLTQVDPSSRESLSALLPAPAWIDQLAVGMAIAVVSVLRPDGPARLWPYWAGAWAFWLGACWVAGPDGSPTDPVTDAGYVGRYLFYMGVVACLLVAAIWSRRGPLLWRPFEAVGIVTFSLYLWHFAWIRELAELWPGGGPSGTAGWLAWGAASLGGSVALGAFGYYVAERPFLRLSRRLRGGSQPRASTG